MTKIIQNTPMMSTKSSGRPTPSGEQLKEKNYYHCYLLKSLDPNHPHKTYIGYTINPQRRIRQHNGILKAGGARRTRVSGRPWTFVLIIHGFQDETSALKFEWAWQHPRRSKIFRSGLPNESKPLAATLESKRGVKAKLQLAQILLCESMPYKEEALTLYFFDERHKNDFQSLFIPAYQSDDEDGQEPWCEALPDNISCRKIDRVEEMPVHANAQKKHEENAKIMSKSDTDDSVSNEIGNNDDDHFSNDDTSFTEYEGQIGEFSNVSTFQARENNNAKLDESISQDENHSGVIDMTDVNSIANNASYNDDDSSSCNSTVDLLSPYSVTKPGLEGGQSRHEKNCFDIRVSLSFDSTASESLSVSPSANIRGEAAVTLSPKQKYYSLGQLSDATSDLDETIDLCSP